MTALALLDGVLVAPSWAVPVKRASMQPLLLWQHLSDQLMDIWLTVPGSGGKGHTLQRVLVY
jgi:hypothetical protein